MSVLLGIDLFESYKNLLENKRIAIITNPTGVNRNFESTIDILHEKFNVVKLFAPEHGVRGNLQAGDLFENYIDEKTKIPIISLYGKTKKISEDMISDIDVIVYDIQDVGSRYYTYLYTLAYAMEACSQFSKQCVVFDRPNPINAIDVEGNMLDTDFKSFIGLYPIPQRYGLTVGECALLFNTEYKINCDLEIVKMIGYKREMYFEDSGLNWILPSPNIPTVETCLAFNSTCIFEGTNISEGRGTTKPFNFIGAPWIDANNLAKNMNELKLPGVYFRPHYFTPTFSKHANQLCCGVEIHILDRKIFKPLKSGLTLFYMIKKLSGSNFEFLPPYTQNGKHMIDYNTGNNDVREGKISLEQLLLIYERQSNEFVNIKTKYHLY